jgi:glycosyltransferase involved in cell wall biosynthesis
MADKIKILFFNRDGAGVNYYRTLTPAQQLERDHSDDFHIEINPDLDLKDTNKLFDYLKTFDIIHYHRALLSNNQQSAQLISKLKKNGTTIIIDIDDYWLLHHTHPFYHQSKVSKMHFDIIENLRMADYVTTTSELFASEIKRVTGRGDNIGVFYNSVDPSWMKQFKDNRKPDPDGRIRFTYMAGSSHGGDVKQLKGISDIPYNSVGDKFKIILAGWDTQGTTTQSKFNQEFGDELRKRKLLTNKMIKSINKSQGNVDLIEGLPNDLKEKYRNKVFVTDKRDIESEESIYLYYEKILTSDYDIIKNVDYIQWLKNYERNRYSDEGIYGRRWTEKANIYAKVLDESDVSLAPLADHSFNRAKSNLKQVECWSRKIPLICTDIPPYNVDGVHMKNSILIPYHRKCGKDWGKAITLLVKEPNLREDLGNQLYEDFHIKYNLHHVTNNRAEFYKAAVYETNLV